MRVSVKAAGVVARRKSQNSLMQYDVKKDDITCWLIPFRQRITQLDSLSLSLSLWNYLKNDSLLLFGQKRGTRLPCRFGRTCIGHSTVRLFLNLCVSEWWISGSKSKNNSLNRPQSIILCHHVVQLIFAWNIGLEDLQKAGVGYFQQRRLWTCYEEVSAKNRDWLVSI